MNSIENIPNKNIQNIFNNSSIQKKLDLFIDILNKLNNIEKNKLFKIDEELKLKKNNIIYQSFSECILKKFEIKMNDLGKLDNNKLNAFK